MSHNYLLALYNQIEKKTRSAQRDWAEAAGDAALRCRAAGRLKALADLEAFLHRRFDHRLPRRIYRRLNANNPPPGAETPSSGHPRAETDTIACRQ